MSNIIKKTTLACIKEYEDRNKDVIPEGLLEQSAIRKQIDDTQFIIESTTRNMRQTQKYNKWSKGVLEAMTYDVIMHIFNECFDRRYYSEDEKFSALKESLVKNFVKEEGAENLVRRFKYTSVTLAECALLIESTHKKITEKVNYKDAEFNIDNNLKSDFFDTLNNQNFESITTKIRERVNDAVEDFITQNTNDRIKIKEILQQTQDNINKAQTEELKESYNINAKRKINIIQQHSRNIFGEMVYNNTKEISKDPELRKIYTNESGHLNMDKIVESCKVMYTFLECLNTAKMVQMDPEKIREIFN